jgi:heme A synthase
MDWSTLAPVLIKAGLGTLGAVVGGPAGGALGAALGQAAAAALGTEPTPDAVAEAVKADPGGAAEKLQHLEDAATALLGKQVDLNARQAESTSFFVAAARPAAFWAADLALLYGGFLQWILGWACVNLALKPPPVMDAGVFSAVLALLFGLCGVRAWEKDRGVARDSWTAPSATGALVDVGAAIIARAAGGRTQRR